MAWRPSRDRSEDVRRALELKAQGLTVTEIARQMGVGRSTASDYVNHPQSGELYRTRNRQYGICPSCGGKMSYQAHQCLKCSRSY